MAGASATVRRDRHLPRFWGTRRASGGVRRRRPRGTHIGRTAMPHTVVGIVARAWQPLFRQPRPHSDSRWPAWWQCLVVLLRVTIHVLWRPRQRTHTACVQFVVTRATCTAITLRLRVAMSLNRLVWGSSLGAVIAPVSKNPRARYHRPGPAPWF